MQLNRYNSKKFDRGSSRLREVLWLVTSALLIGSWLPGSSWRIWLLRCFGAKVGSGAVIKPRVRVKFPWRLSIGAHCWIGEGTWIDNLAQVSIGQHACISQGAYLCTGSHDWGQREFDLIVQPITIGDHVWIGAKSRIAPGCRCGDGVVVTLGSVASGTLTPWTIYQGHPAHPIRKRTQSGRSIPVLDVQNALAYGQERLK